MTFALTPYAVQQADVLRRIGDESRPIASTDALARELERDGSNLRKTLKVLKTEDLVRDGDPERGEPSLVLTDSGREAIAALDRAEGRLVLPEGVVRLRHDQLAPHPLNPRKNFDSEDALQDLDGLRESIVLRRAVRQSLEVTPPAEANGVHFIVSGERRWRAVGAAIADGDLPEDFLILCTIKQPKDAAEHLFDALDENLQRRDLSPVEEGRAFLYARDELGQTTRQISERVGRSQKHVQDRIALIEKVPAEDLARMELPKDDPDYLPYYKVREQLMQARKPQAPEPEPAPAGHEPRSTFQAMVGGFGAATSGYRTPSGPTVAELLPPGAIVRTNYGTGPYAVVNVSGPHAYAPPEGGTYQSWGLGLCKPDEFARGKETHWINEVVAVDGRLLQLFAANTDEVFVDERPAAAAQPAPATPVGRTSHGLTPSQLLVLAEIAHKVVANPAEGYQRTEIRADADIGTLDGLAGHVSYTLVHPIDGRAYALLGYGGRTLLERWFPSIFTDEADTTLDQMRRDAGVLAAEDQMLAVGTYATAWLNGPFELSEAGRARLAEREAEQARLEQEEAAKQAAAAAEKARGERMLQDMKAIADEIGRTTFAALDDRIENVLLAGGVALPLSLDEAGRIVDAEGRALQGEGDALTARRLILVLGVNAAAGLRTPPEAWGGTAGPAPRAEITPRPPKPDEDQDEAHPAARPEGPWNDDAFDAEQQLLARARGFDLKTPGGATAFAALLQEAGLAGAVSGGPDNPGVIWAADGQELAVVDTVGRVSDEVAEARAQLIETAIAACVRAAELDPAAPAEAGEG